MIIMVLMIRVLMITMKLIIQRMIWIGTVFRELILILCQKESKMGKNIYNDQKSLKMMKTKKMKTMMRKTMLMKTMLMKTKMMKAMTMKAMMMKTMMMKMMIMKTLMMKTVMMADQQQDSLSAAKAVPEELQVQVRASFLAREKPWIEKSEKTKVIQCFNSRLQ